MTGVSKPSVHRRVFTSTGIVMGGILASRLLGFFREWAVAHQVGSNAMTDAYYAAFTLPDFLNYLVAGASLSATFIPVFAKYSAEGREDEAWWVFSTVMTFMGVLLARLDRGSARSSRRNWRTSDRSRIRSGRAPTPYLSHAPHAAGAVLLLPGQHPQRRAVRQGTLSDSFSRARRLQRDDRPRRHSARVAHRHDRFRRRRARRSARRQFSSPGLRRHARWRPAFAPISI